MDRILKQNVYNNRNKDANNGASNKGGVAGGEPQMVPAVGGYNNATQQLQEQQPLPPLQQQTLPPLQQQQPQTQPPKARRNRNRNQQQNNHATDHQKSQQQSQPPQQPQHPQAKKEPLVNGTS